MWLSFFLRNIYECTKDFSPLYKGVDCINGFAKTYFPEEFNASERKPISIESIKHIQKLCEEEDDELRWLIALISDTGMRLGETVGLLK